MKTMFSAIVFVIILTIFGCSKEKNNSTSTITNPPDNSHGYLVEGKIVAEFVDTLSQEDAENFLLAHNLTVYVLYNFAETPPHSSIIDVPIGQEEALIDTLSKYSEIKHADRLAVMQISN